MPQNGALCDGGNAGKGWARGWYWLDELGSLAANPRMGLAQCPPGAPAGCTPYNGTLHEARVYTRALRTSEVVASCRATRAA